MYQIDVPSAAATLPAPATAGTPGFFTEGNPLTGAPATVVAGDFLNTIMLELLAIVAAGGIAPAKGTNNQVLAAIKALVTGNLAPSGHIIIPVGSLNFILNWGNGSHTDGSGGKAVVFDLPFPTAGLIPMVSNSANAPPVAFHGAGGVSKTGMTVYSAKASSVAADSGTAFNYYCLGF